MTAIIFCAEKQILDECVAFTTLLPKVYRDFDFTDIVSKITTRPDKRDDADRRWDEAEHALMASLQRWECEYVVLPREGAFYGPRIAPR